MLRDPAEWSLLVADSGIASPYCDPKLRHNPKEYAAFLKRLDAAGMLRWRKACGPERATVGVFFVFKSDGESLRLIFDTRWANLAFQEPASTRLPTASAWSNVELAGDAVMAQGDIQCAYYHLRLPAGMEEFFTLPSLSNRFLGLDAISGDSVSIHDGLVPMIVVAPMGWSWALHFCQSTVVRALEEEGFSPYQRVEDGAVAPALLVPSAMLAAGYVDNFAIVGGQADSVTAARDRVKVNLERKGLPIHDMGDATHVSIFTGLEFDGKRGTLRARGDRLRRLDQALRAAERRGRMSGPAMSALLGHCTWAMLCRRETLSFLSAMYAFQRRAGDTPIQLWPSVLKEMRWLRSTLPMWKCYLRLQWLPVVTTSDASPWGLGACVQSASAESVREIAKTSEKWRYRVTAAINARDHAFNAFEGPTEAQCLSYENDHEAHLSFAEVPADLLEFHRWLIVISNRHSIPFKNILEYEGDALVIGLRRALRAVSAHHCRHLSFVDNLALALAAGKGRGKTSRLRRPLRQFAALCLAGNVRVFVRWIPSERNAADPPSRRGFFGGPSFDEHAAAKMFGFDAPLQPPPGLDLEDGSTAVTPGPATRIAGRVDGAGHERRYRSDLQAIPAAHGHVHGMVPVGGRRLDDGASARRGAGGLLRSPISGRIRRGVGARNGHRAPSLSAGSSWRRSSDASQFEGPSRVAKAGASTHATTVAASGDGSRGGLPPALRVGRDGYFRGPRVRRVPPAQRGVSPHGRLPGAADFGSGTRSSPLGSYHQQWRRRGVRQDGYDRRERGHRFPAPLGRARRPQIREAGGDVPVDLLTGADEAALQGGLRRAGAVGGGPVDVPASARRGEPRLVDATEIMGRHAGAREVVDRRVVEALRQAHPSSAAHQLDGPGASEFRRDDPGQLSSLALPSRSHRTLRSANPATSARPTRPPQDPARADAAVDLYLTRLLARATGAATRHGRLVALELFGGRGNLTPLWRQTGLGTVTIDLRRHPLLDVACPSLMRRLRGWVRSSLVRMVWISPPQDTWSLLARPQVRTAAEPWGVDGLATDVRQQLRVNNWLFMSTLSLIAECEQHRVPCILEAPSSSAMWFTRELRPLARSSSCAASKLDLCAYGSRWKRATTLLSWHCPNVVQLASRCSSHGKCLYGGRPHLQTTALAPAQRGWRATAQQLPPKLRRACAELLDRAADGLARKRMDWLFGLTAR